MMGDREKSYEEVHATLVEEMEKASLEYSQEKERNGEPKREYDLSFMKSDQSRKKKSRFSRFAKVAAIIIVALLGINIAVVSLDTTDTYGDKGILHRIYQGFTGLFTDREEQPGADDIEESLSITDMKDIEKAKTFLPVLYVPQYIPEGYVLESLLIEKYYSGDFWGEYVYRNESEQKILILFNFSASGANVYQTQDDGELIDLEDRKIYMTIDDLTGETYVSVYMEDCSMDISGHADQETLVEIAKGLEK